MKVPIYQRIIKGSLFVLLGVLALGNLLDAIGNAVSIITPIVTYVSTIILLLVWVVIELLTKFKRVPWLLKDQRINVTGIGVKIRLSLLGIVLLLWVPRVVDLYRPQQVAETPKTIEAEQHEYWNRYDWSAYPQPLGKYDPSKYRIRYLIFHTKWQLQADGPGPGPVQALVLGKLKKSIPELFNSEPYIISTEAFARLLDLKKSIPGFFDADNDRDYISSLDETPDTKKIQDKFNADPLYYIYSRETYGSTFRHPFGFVGARNYEQLLGKYKKIPKLTSSLIKNNPDIVDVAIEQLFYEECEGTWEIRFNNRPLKILVMDIENLSNQPLPVDYLEGISHIAPPLKLTPWNDQTSTSEKVKYEFSQKLLAANEHLLVPMKLFLGSFGDYDFFPHPESLPESFPETTMTDFVEGEEFSTKDFVLHVAQKKREPNLHNEYIIGSWFEPVTVGSLGEIRPFSKSDLVYHSGLEMASCPFAFLYNTEKGVWENVGRLIPDRIGKENEGENKLRIAAPSDGKILIKELEREVSFLDQLYLEVEDFHGNRSIIYPKDNLLKEGDFQYQVLREGEQLLVEFELPTKRVKNYTLVSRGYFVLDPLPQINDN